MKVRIAVPPWIARDLEPFADTKVRLGQVQVAHRAPRYGTDSTIELIVSDKAVAAHLTDAPEPAGGGLRR